MAEKSTPNTFSAGMITDLDPAYQSKESYFTGLNIRVITNGDKSFSLETIQGPQQKFTNGNLMYSVDYKVHGAEIVDDYLIVIEKQHDSTVPHTTGKPQWKILKYTNLDSGTLTATKLWGGSSLFDDNAGRIEMEVVVETENLHRIYCTDGISGLKSINVKDSDIANKSVSDFLAFKPNVMSGVELIEYNQVGGALNYGAYSYVYRLGSQSQGHYTDWSPISQPINIIKNDLSSNSSLGVEGESSGFISSTSLKLKIPNIPEHFQSIQVAAIKYVGDGALTISIVEEGSVSSTNYIFTHSGFEAEKIVEGGIAAAIISAENWDSCKVLAQKDNKLYAANLKSTVLDIDSIIEGYGKMRSYKGVEDGSGDWTLEAHAVGSNPHRHYNGSGGNWSWDENLDVDKTKYKFINKNFTTGASSSSDPSYVLGAETDGYSTGSYGFRMTFTQESYVIDDTFNRYPDGVQRSPHEDLDSSMGSPNFYTVNSSSNNDDDYGGGSKGPHNPVWDNKFRSYKRGECYRFGIVFFDKQGAAGFAYHIGDIKMPDALDPNGQILNAVGDDAIDKPYNTQNKCWSPFSVGSDDDEVVAHALIPKLEVKLPTEVLDVISGFRIVRAELTENDKTIITQGIFSALERSHGVESDNDNLRGKMHPPGQPLHHTAGPNGSTNPFKYRIPQGVGIMDSPDMTLRGMSYHLSNGFSIRPAYLLEGNSVSETGPHTAGATMEGGYLQYNNYHKVFGLDVDTNLESGSIGTAFHVYKWRPWSVLTESSTSDEVKQEVKFNYNSYSFFRWHRDLYLAKTVVNQEIVPAADFLPAGDESFINQAAVYKTNQFDDGPGNNDEDVGELHQDSYGDSSRCRYDGETPTTLFLSLSDNENVPLPGRVKFDYNDISGTSTGQSLSYYNDNDHRSVGAASTTPNWFEGFKWVAEVIRDTSSGFEQYGGDSDSAIENTRFYPCRDFVPTSSQWDTYPKLATGGDVYCDWYTYKNMWRTDTSSSFQYGTVVPLESYVNVALRSGTYLGKDAEVKVNIADSFLYNDTYSTATNLVSYAVKPAEWVTNDLFKAKVSASKTKILGETFDAWTVFPANDFAELNLANGNITDLVNHKNQLYAIQDSGIALLSVNSRALIQGEGAAADIQIVTGTGAAIERYDYLTTEFGSQHFNTSTKTPTGFYLFDSEKEDIIKCDGQSIVPLALSTNYKSYLAEINSGTIPINVSSSSSIIGLIDQGIFSGYDPKFRECHYTVVKSDNSSNSFSISDLTGALVSKLELRAAPSTAAFDYTDNIITNKYITYKNDLYSFSYLDYSNSTYSDSVLYLMNKGVYQHFNVGFIVNDNPTFNKVFDSSEIITDEVTSFTSHSLVDSIGNAITGSNERERDGIHKVSLRNDSSTKRLRGSWLKYTLSYTQTLDDDDNIDTGSVNKKFNIFAVNTRFRNSR